MDAVSAGVTILLSLTVFLNMVAETMPVTSDNPLLGNRGSAASQSPACSYCTLGKQAKRYMV